MNNVSSLCTYFITVIKAEINENYKLKVHNGQRIGHSVQMCI